MRLTAWKPKAAIPARRDCTPSAPIPLYAKWRLRDNARLLDVNALADKKIGRNAALPIARPTGRLTLSFVVVGELHRHTA
jgi:hypothetical protein